MPPADSSEEIRHGFQFGRDCTASQQDFQAPVAYVTGTDARGQTAYTVELTLFRRLLALGAAQSRVFFVTRAALRPAEPVLAPDHMPLRHDEQRSTTYYSVFGKVRFGRCYLIAPEQLVRPRNNGLNCRL